MRTKKLLMMIALLCTIVQGAWAESVTFNVCSWDDVNKQVVTTTDTKDCTVLAGNPGEWMQLGDTDDQDHYYVVKGNVSYMTLNCFGRVHLILADGATLTLNGGLKVEKDNNAHLFIYSQSDGDSQGKLIVTNSYERAAGIGGGLGWDCGEITIHGGILDVTGGQYAAGIGAGGAYSNTTNTEGRSPNGGTTIVYGGEVTVHGGDSGAGIGGGAGSISSWTSNGGNFYLYGGTVTATGGEYAAGIGGGGGYEKIMSNRYGPGGKSSKVYVYGGNLTAQGGRRAAGIGGGNNGGGWNGGWDKDFELYVYNGTVNATGGDYGAGIGGGCNCNGGKVYIYDGNVTAKGGEDAAGIGGGEDGLGGELHVSGGTVRAEGKGCGAGIGGGEYTNQKGSSTQGTGANTYITGGTVIAIAGGDCKARNAKGGSAIGAGQGVENKDDSDKAKVLEIPVNYMVTGGDAENNIERVFTNGERIGACRWRNYVKIEKCSHKTPTTGDDTSEAITYSIDDEIYHTKHCRYCNTTWQEEHQGTDCVCGKTSFYRFTVHHPGTEKDTYGESSTIAVGASMDFYLPGCKNVPEGYTFKGWEMNPATDDVNRWAAVRGGDQSADINMPAGTSVKTHLGQDKEVHFYARFLYDFTPTWTWAENGSSASVTLSHKDLEGVTLSSTDADSKVSIKQEVLKDEADNAIGTRYTATCIYELNGYEYTFTDTYLLPVGNLVLYDDASNEDNLDTYHGRKVNTLMLQGRTLYADGSWNTLCLPFSLSAEEVYTQLNPTKLKTLGSTSFNSETGTLTLNFIDATTIEAGKPYIIKWTSGGDRTDPSFSNVTIYNDFNAVTTDYVTFTGFFSPVSLEANDKTVLYLGAGNKLYWPSADVTVGSCRAVFLLKGITAGDLTAGVRSFVMDFGDGDTTTGIVNAEANSSLFTLHSSLSEWYDLQGRRLNGKPSQKGLYINNGRKVVIK